MSDAKRITLDDLSAHLQLSKFSVSRALSGKQGVSQRTRENVIRVARELGYDHPSLNPEQKAKEQHRILLAIPRADAVNNAYWIETISGAEAEARRLGWFLVTTMVEDGVFSQDRIAGAAGVLLAGRRSRGVLAPFLTASLPTVLIGYPHAGEKIDAVHVENWEAGQLIGRHLVGLGHKVVAFITDAPADEGRNERLRGCAEVLAEMCGGRVVKVLFNPETEAGTLVDRLRKTDEDFTAILSGSDDVTFRIMWELQEAGLRVPEDVSVVGSTDTTSNFGSGLTMTAMCTPMLEIGAAAMNLLAWRMASKEALLPRRVALSTDLLVGGSTGPAPAHGPVRARKRVLSPGK